MLKNTIFSELHRNGITNIKLNDDTLIKLIDMGKERKYLRISSDSALFVKNEEILIDVSEDAMKCYIYFNPPGKGGRLLTEEEILSFLTKKNITRINKEAIKSALIKKDYSLKYLVAEGVYPLDEYDGYIEVLFDYNKKAPKPVITEDKRADYRNLNYVENALKGQILARRVNPAPGKEGIDIYGNPVPYKKGKLAPPLLAGRNTVISDDNNELIASKSGEILYMGRRISVSEVLEINSDIGTATGNIDFVGSIKIKGSVGTDYEVKSAGNIEIFGTFEGKSLIAEGDITVSGGIQGKKNTIISAKGNLSAKFLSGAEINTGGSIYSDSIIRCKVICGGSIELCGAKTVISGGAAVVHKFVEADVIGSAMAAPTEVMVGLDPVLYIRYMEISGSIEELKGKAEEYAKSIGVFKRNGLMELSEERKKTYYGFVHSLKYATEKISELSAEAAKIKEVLDNEKNSGEISVKEIIHGGVKIQVGNSVMYIRDSIKKCRITNENNKIVIKNQ